MLNAQVNKPEEIAMLTIAIVSVVLLPIAVDLAIGKLRPVKGDLPLKHR